MKTLKIKVEDKLYNYLKAEKEKANIIKITMLAIAIFPNRNKETNKKTDVIITDCTNCK